MLILIVLNNLKEKFFALNNFVPERVTNLCLTILFFLFPKTINFFKKKTEIRSGFFRNFFFFSRLNSNKDPKKTPTLLNSKSRKNDRVNKLRNLLASSSMTPTSSGALSMFLSTVNNTPIIQKTFKK